MDKTKHSAPDLLVAVDRRSRMPLTDQIYGGLRAAILGGRLVPGSRLPPTRAMAQDLAVSRTVVVFAYERLATEGYVTGRGSAGSFVSRLDLSSRPAPDDRRGPGRARPLPTRLARAFRASTGLPSLQSAAIPFRIGEPAADLFPERLWSHLHGRLARRDRGASLGYGTPGGDARLRAAIAAYARAARGVAAEAGQVILTRGAQQGLDLVARVVLEAGDKVWVEDPGYLAARALLSLGGASLVPVPVDEEGLVVAAGVRLAPRARLACVSPTHQFPLGATMSLSRRLALLAWAGRTGGWIVEDDFDSEFRYDGAPIPSLQGLDRAERVIYVGTFSKTVFPSLRMGYLIAPPALAEVLQRAQTLLDHMAPSLEQATLAEFIEGGWFARHVRRMRAEYRLRQEALLEGIREELHGVMHAAPAHTGMHVVAWFDDREIDDQAVAARARGAGVEVAPLSQYALKVKLPPALLLGFAAVAPSALRPALRLLRRCVEQVSASSAGAGRGRSPRPR